MTFSLLKATALLTAPGAGHHRFLVRTGHMEICPTHSKIVRPGAPVGQGKARAFPVRCAWQRRTCDRGSAGPPEEVRPLAQLLATAARMVRPLTRARAVVRPQTRYQNR